MTTQGELTLDELRAINPDEHDNPGLIRRLRDQAEAKALTNGTVQSERDTALRENAFLRAGIDPGSPLGKAFATQVDGVPGDTVKLGADFLSFKKELGLPDEITAPAGGNGETTPDPTAAAGEQGGTTPPAREPTGTTQRQELSNGALAPDVKGLNTRQAIREQAVDAMHKGATFAEAAGGLVNATVLGWARDEIPSLVGDGVPARQ